MQVRRFAIVFGILLLSQFSLTGFVCAQFWAALPSLKNDNSASICFAQDEKSVFYLSNEGGTKNIFRVAVKGGAPVQITKFTNSPVLRVFHSLGSRQLIFMRGQTATDTDYHIYTIKDDGTGEMNDVTPSGAGTVNTMIGESYNGRYVYYTANKESLTKLDCYRYDVQQYISELVFPNDKDYKMLAWSRDNDKLLVEDPGTEAISLFNVETTEFQKLTQPTGGSHFIQALLTPDNKKLGVLESSGGAVTEKWSDINSISWNTAPTTATHLDFSANGKYKIATIGTTGVMVIDVGTSQPTALTPAPKEVAIAPKETLIAFVTQDQSGIRKLELFDAIKKTTTELATIR